MAADLRVLILLFGMMRMMTVRGLQACIKIAQRQWHRLTSSQGARLHRSDDGQLGGAQHRDIDPCRKPWTPYVRVSKGPGQIIFEARAERI